MGVNDMLQGIMLALAAVLIAVDQVTKYFAVCYLKDQPSIPLWTNVFELKYLPNDGIAWGLLDGQQWLFVPVTCVVMALMLVMLLRSDLRNRVWFSLSCTLILAGGIGNLIDRIANGYVVDFLYFKLINFPIFNFADCCVVVGAFILFAFLLFGCKESEFPSMRGLVIGSKRGGKENADDDRNKTVDRSTDGQG